jgi:uncharacterized cupin superfamily protein
MTAPYHWHCHPDSDESFLALEGGLFIDFDDRTVELPPGHMITVNRGVRHRTKPVNGRSILRSSEAVHRARHFPRLGSSCFCETLGRREKFKIHSRDHDDYKSGRRIAFHA